jgi:hypothetical protein
MELFQMRTRVLASLLPLMLLSAACGQTQPDSLTWIRFYSVPPGREEAFVTEARRTGDALDTLMSEGHLLSWGVATPLNRSRDDQWTHLIWLSLPGWAAVQHVLNRPRDWSGSPDSAAMPRDLLLVPNRRDERGSLLYEHGSVHDLVLRDVASPARPAGSAAPAFMRLSFHKVRHTHERGAIELYRAVALPLYEREMARGVVIDAAMMVQELVADPSWTHLSWIMTPDLESLGRLRDDAAEIDSDRPAMEIQAIIAQMRDHMDLEAHRSRILRIVLVGEPQTSR